MIAIAKLDGRLSGRLAPLMAVMAMLSGAATVSLAGDSPYAGQERRDIKALSAAQLGDIEAGRGMGLALPAELNGYPGPSHTLALAEQLGLTVEQRTKTERLFAAMQQEARATGAAYVEREAALEQLFRDRQATPQRLEQAVAAAGQQHAALRLVHLRYHLAMVDLLTPEQVQRYNALRGYGGHHSGGGHTHQ